jgi:iron complex outermembrane recepter protein
MSYRNGESAAPQPTLRRGLLFGASALALGWGAPSLAQTADAPQQESDAAQDDGQAAADSEIVVTGLRAALASAQSIKMNSDQFVDSITAIDIGKLPDVNVAEALQRVSGVQITRNRGEGSGIAIRGLTEVRTEINGRDAFGGSGGRALGFEDVPSELLAGVDVYKNPSAELIEGGIGGLVNLRTRMPFDQKGPLIAGTFGGNYYDLVDKVKPNWSVLYSDRWDTPIGEIGLLLDYSYFQGAYRSDEATVEPYFDFTNVPGSTVPAYQGIGNKLLPDGGGIGLSRGLRERQGYYGALQWRPSADVEVYAQFFRSKYMIQDDRISSFITCYSDDGSAAPAYSNQSCLQGLTPNGEFEFDDEGHFVRGGFNGFGNSANNSQVSTNHSQTTDISGGINWQATSRLKVNLDVQYVKSSFSNGNYSVFAQQDGPLSAYFDLSGDYAQVRFGPEPQIFDPSRYYLIAVMDHLEDSEADQVAARLDLEWNFDDASFLRGLTAGARYTDRSATNRSTPYVWTYLSAPWGGNAIYLDDDPTYLMPNPGANNFFHGPESGSVGNVPLFNTALLYYPEYTFNSLYARAGSSRPMTEFTDNDVNVQAEKTLAGYAMARFGWDMGSVPVDGNLGLRVTRTENSASGQYQLTYFTDATGTTNATVTQPIAADESYLDWQPSLNLRAKLQPDLFLRFAAARALSRPAFANLKAVVALSQDCDRAGGGSNACQPGTVRYTGEGENPYLKPQISNQIDLALEWYPKSTSMLYVTGFYKWLEDIIQDDLFTLPYEVPGQGTQNFTVEGPVNYGTGYIRGFEVGARTFFDFLPGPLDGLGVEGNFTYVDSKVPSPFARDENNQPIETTKQGLSKYSYNLIGFYEKGGLSMRAAYNWRSSYLETASGNGTGFLPIYYRPYGQLDASINYDITPNIAVSLNAVNLLRQVKSQYQVDSWRWRLDQLDDRRIGFSIRIRN